MFKSTRHLLIGASVLALAVPAFAQSSKTSLKKDELAKEAEKSKFSGSFGVVIGSDSNLLDTKNVAEGTFYELKPSLNYTSGIFSADLGAGIKEFSDQTISNNAKETSANIDLSINTTIFADTKSSTKLSFGYSDVRLPDYFGDTDAEVFEGNGMPHKNGSIGISQGLDWEYDRLTIGVNASHKEVDYSTQFSDFAKNIDGAILNELDYSQTEGSAKVGIKFHKNLTLSSTPLVSYKKYDDRDARNSAGQRPGQNGNFRKTEYLNNELKTQLDVNVGALTLTPHITSGIQIDQANGGEDYRFTDAGLSAAVLLNEANNVKLTASLGTKNVDYDNWTYNLSTADRTREDDTVTSSLGAAFDISKSMTMNVDYSNQEKESNYNSGDHNFRREIISTGLTLKF